MCRWSRPGARTQIPIFDGGEVRIRQATETYNQAFNLLTEKAVNVRSEARDAYRVYRSTYDIARQYQREVLPLRPAGRSNGVVNATSKRTSWPLTEPSPPVNSFGFG